MGFLALLSFGFLLNVAQSLEMQDAEAKDMVLDHNVTGVLGEEVYLRCLYTGQSEVLLSSWNRLDSRKKLSGYNSQRSFSKDEDFSTPASLTNLTVRVNVSRLEAEGEYTCAFNTEEEITKGSTFLNVLARPAIRSHVKEEVEGGTHYQSVTCSALNGKPVPLVTWEMHGTHPTADIFSIETTNSSHLNGTSSVSSVLRFPTHLNDEGSVTCVVQHPAWPAPIRTIIDVQTFVAPSVTVETVLRGEFREVTCRAAGGRPHPNITWALPGGDDADQAQRDDQETDTAFSSSYRLPAGLYEGETVTCIFGHPKLASKRRAVTLPTYSLSSLQLLNHNANTNNESQTMLSVLLDEGEPNITIKLKVVGDVPSYTINCTKDARPLPEGVEVVESALRVQGPVEPHHAGRYECGASYRRHKASLQLEITVRPRVQLPVAVPPKISVDIREEPGSRVIECLAAGAVPAANVSWVLPPDVSGRSWSNATAQNGTHSVRSVLVLPACSPREQRVECVVEHPLFVERESRERTLPACARPNIAVLSSTVWEEGTAYTQLECRVDSVRPAATVAWSIGDADHDGSADELGGVVTHLEARNGGSVSVRSVVRLPSVGRSGRNVTCVVAHQGLETPERRSVQLQPIEPPVVHVSVGEQRDSPLWLAVCQYSGDGVTVSLSWVLPDNSTGQSTSYSTREGVKVRANATYAFPLALHEGHDLTCLIQHGHGLQERRTVRVPQYYISSVAVRSKATLCRIHGADTVHRVSLQENLPNQKIYLKVYGNTPAYQVACFRSDGSAAQTVGGALVFPRAVSEREAGLYTCHASYFHHQATVLIQVDVTSEEAQHSAAFQRPTLASMIEAQHPNTLGECDLTPAYMPLPLVFDNVTFVIICFTSAAAIALILIVTLCVFCKRNGGDHSSAKKHGQKRESLTTLTSLVQNPRSPELRKPALPGGNGQKGKGHEYAELVGYSIVIDIKTTV